jgi:hypothetical protein
LHILESTIKIAFLLTLPRFKPTTGAWPVADLTGLQRLELMRNGIAENSHSERRNKDEKIALHGLEEAG